MAAFMGPVWAVENHDCMKKKKKNHYILSGQLRADQMPGPPREGQLVWTLMNILSKHASMFR